MKSKYYKPEISEFHPGFEYQERVTNSTGTETEHWIDCVWTEKHNFDELFDVEYYDGELIKISVPDSIRVKKLDRDDVIDLGFDEKIENMYHIKVDEYRGERDRVFSLFIAGVTLIYMHRGNGEFATVFTGIINNKSELRRVLKQVGIIK